MILVILQPQLTSASKKFTVELETTLYQNNAGSYYIRVKNNFSICRQALGTTLYECMPINKLHILQQRCFPQGVTHQVTVRCRYALQAVYSFLVSLQRLTELCEFHLQHWELSSRTSEKLIQSKSKLNNKIGINKNN